MPENVKRFLEIVSKENALIERLRALNEETEIIAMAAEFGIVLTAADFGLPEGEMSTRELADVTGGADSGGCGCLLAGGGGGTQMDGDTYGCACVGYGQGGDGSADDFTCWCTGAGEGNLNNGEDTDIIY